AAALFALLRNPRYDGVATDVRMPRIALTTSSSMSVMPLSSRASRLPSARSINWVIDGLVDVGDPRSRDVDYRGERETREGAVSGALCVSRVGRGLRECVAGAGAAGCGGAVDLGDGRDCGGRGALGDLGGVAADVVGAVTDGLVVGEAVGSTGAEDLDRDVGGDAGGFLGQVGVAEAGVAAVAAGGVLVPGLCGRDGRADVGLGRSVLGVAAEAEVGRHRDGNEDAEDDDDDQEIDEGETAHLTGQARLDLAEHEISFRANDVANRSLHRHPLKARLASFGGSES